MKSLNSASVLSDSKTRTCLWSLFIAASLICGAYFICSSFISKDYRGRLTRWQVIYGMQKPNSNACKGQSRSSGKNPKSDTCKDQCRPSGSEVLPQGIVVKTSNLGMLPLWSYHEKNNNPKPSMSLLTIAAGIKQKEIVKKIVKKFPLSHFVVMIFHYDGIVDEWRDLEWSHHAIHVSAVNQTKWWFAKRFLHPDIVAEYNYIFLWDEDLGVENFDPRRYLSIVEREGLEISQPALDPKKSEIHHQITVRSWKSTVHRRAYKFRGHGRCDNNSTGPPCIGWVEMMAPVFSRAAWRCVWYMIQNDLIHAWGLDKLLGYCAQGDRTKNVGVVDAEYIVHMGFPTLGGSDKNEMPSEPHKVNRRGEVRMQSSIEMEIFKKRWENATKEDICWVDPYGKPSNQSSHRS